MKFTMNNEIKPEASNHTVQINKSLYFLQK